MFLLIRVVHGFRVINKDCGVNYRVKERRCSNSWGEGIIREKFQSELASGNIAQVTWELCCSNTVFVVPKDDGGGRTVVDCSKPEGQSVNQHTDGMSAKFSYKGLDNVTNILVTLSSPYIFSRISDLIVRSPAGKASTESSIILTTFVLWGVLKRRLETPRGW